MPRFRNEFHFHANKIVSKPDYIVLSTIKGKLGTSTD